MKTAAAALRSLIAGRILFPGQAVRCQSLLISIAISLGGPASAETEWLSFTMDNDLFVGNDNGYTNGFYLSWYDTPSGDKPTPGYLARALLWSLSDTGDQPFQVDIKTIGQTLITPDDISLDPPIPPPDDLPYGGMLFYSDTWLEVYDRYADKISVTLGLVGTLSLAEETQRLVHQLTASDEPCCWDRQLDDEIVFQLSRARVWKAWVSANGNMDFLVGADAQLGTIESSLGVAFMFRYGRDMRRTFATELLVNSRNANPVAVQSGWYLFAGARAGYTENVLFLDGNTFDDDDDVSIDYDAESLALTTGIAYAWQSLSFTFALNDLNANEELDGDSADEYSQYGTFTLAWKLE